jgi:hypothetical protein
VIAHEVTLFKQPAYTESAERVGDTKWHFEFFNLSIELNGPRSTDPAVNQFSERDSYNGGRWLQWPSRAGSYVPTDQLAMPWEMHGARLGYQDTGTVVAKRSYDGSLVGSSPLTVYKLNANETIVVPVQVAVVLPDYTTGSGSAIGTVMRSFLGDYQNVLWDDVWKAVGRQDGPNDPPRQANWEWTHRTAEISSYAQLDVPYPWSGVAGDLLDLSFHWVTVNGRERRSIQPDDIFIRCGIQFRIVAYKELRLPREFVEFPDICFGDDIGRQVDAIANKSKESPNPFSPNLPIAIFTYRVQGDQCETRGYKPQPGIGCDGGSFCNSAGTAAVGVGQLNGRFPRDVFVLSHELGHVLSLPHASEVDCAKEAGTPSAKLMCGGIGELGTQIPEAACRTARSKAVSLRRSYIGF